eukprot:TRINITY_DN5608_c0_g1_i1.p1 TRINITY_DN5608_c0_g1~~TRINITY_DN5608_c0_g1_i1.p1  ORF type:complete len:265 (-),score=55.33 TRINITY_DN5608_c0_g1_i1:208-966(-)
MEQQQQQQQQQPSEDSAISVLQQSVSLFKSQKYEDVLSLLKPFVVYDQKNDTSTTLRLLKEMLEMTEQQIRLHGFYSPITKELPVYVSLGINDYAPQSSTTDFSLRKKSGKGLFARNSFKKGDVIFTEKPLFSIQKTFNRSDVIACSYCLKTIGAISEKCRRSMMDSPQPQFRPSTPFAPKCDPPLAKEPISCRDCHSEIYCSEECLNKGKEEYHQILCRRRPAADSTSMLHFQLLSDRLTFFSSLGFINLI